MQLKIRGNHLRLCNKATITIPGVEEAGNVPGRQAAKEADKRNKEVIFENCTLLTDMITEINNTQVENVKDLANTYSKSSGSLW